MIQVLLLTLVLPTAVAGSFLLLIGRRPSLLYAVGLGHVGHLTGGAIRIGLALDAPSQPSLVVVTAWMLLGVVVVWLLGWLMTRLVQRLRRPG